MRVWEWVDMLRRLAIFTCQYNFAKCMRTAVCGLVVMLPLLLACAVRRRRAGRWADAGFYSWLLLFPAALTGMSRLFYQHFSYRLTEAINRLGATWVSGVYIAVMLALAGWWLCRRRILNRQVRALPCWRRPQDGRFGDRTGWLSCFRQVTAGNCLGLARWYLNRVRVYISEEEGSPFCGGVLRPYIVMPEAYLEPQRGVSPSQEGGKACQEDRKTAIRRRLRRRASVGGVASERRLTRQGEVLLCHELLHLKYGHILWLNLFVLLRIYWWANPLIYLCEKLLQQDMELACDEGSLYYTAAGEREYGRLLLTVAAGQASAKPVGAASFLRDRDYRSLRSRIERLRREGGQYSRRHRFLSWGCTLALTAGLLAVTMTSYPRYTRMPELVLYDEELQMICNNSPQLREAVQVVDGYLRIDARQMDVCLAELGVAGNYVYLGYDTIMKVPGAGGGGNVGMIAVGDYEDIFYLRAETWENDFLEFFLKYLL